MADTQEDDLPQATALNAADFLRMVADLAGTPVSKVISRANVKTYFDTLYEPVGGGGTGWQTVTETWTRTGNHTFTVVGDLTAKYGKGTKVRYKDGGAFEYGRVGSSSFSSPNTTINLIPNTDYAMAAATITDTAISYQENPQGDPGWFNWAPSPTGFSAVPTFTIYRWTTQANMITLNYDEGANGTSNATTFTASAPIALEGTANLAIAVCLGTTVDNSVLQTTPGRVTMAAGSATMTFRKDTATGAWTSSGGKRAIVTVTYQF